MARSVLDGLNRLLVRPRRLLRALAHDAAGNVLAIMAASIIPLAAFSGSAIDTARLYVVKVRLQQACDAGVLAGRKYMVDTNPSTPLETNAVAQANAFFFNDFKTGWFQTSNVVFTPTKTSDSQVLGNASATVPMTIMKMFGAPAVTVSVDCTARYDVADTDVMFVLDTTGSMSCLSSDSESACDSYVVGATHQLSDGSWTTTEKPNSRIDDLRDAVVNFYDQVTAGADPTTHFRFGFMPYNATVNVGYLLPRNYLSTTNWTYQSRQQVADVTNGSSSSQTYNNLTQAACNAYNSRTPTSGYTTSNTYTLVTATWTRNGILTTGTCVVVTQPWIANFVYQPVSLNIANYASRIRVTTPTVVQQAPGVTQPSSLWAGCIEERDTTATATFNAASPPPDLDVDTAPTSEETRWRPMWPEVEYARQSSPETSSIAGRNPSTRYQFGSNGGRGNDVAGPYNELPCPKQATRLATMTRQQISDYVNAADFAPYGVTYHDIGMTWGTRLLSPTGIFASDTAAWPGRNSPNRYIIFMTDGSMEPDAYAYAAHGIEQLDGRVTGSAGTGQLTNYHNARFTTACQIAKNRGITLFVISYAQAVTPAMTTCASPAPVYYASDKTTLNAAFAKIAKQIASLRLSQ